MDFGFWTVEFGKLGVWIMDFGFWTVEFGMLGVRKVTKVRTRDLGKLGL